LELNKHFVRILRALADVDARYLLVGAYAVDFYGQPRTTRHMDVWLDDAPDNLECAYRALARFGAPALAVEHLSAASPLEVVWIGVPPDRIDLVKGMRGLHFAEAWSRRMTTKVDGVTVPIIGRDDLIAAKRATEREKDLADAEALVAQRPG
jgi:predicted nucleotidyltransferase